MDEFFVIIFLTTITYQIDWAAGKIVLKNVKFDQKIKWGRNCLTLPKLIM